MTAADTAVRAIDVHAHLVPRALLDALERGTLRFPGIELLARDGQRALAFAGNPPTRPIPARLMDVEQRHDWMEAERITLQVVAGWLDMYGYELPASEGAAWARTLNEYTLAATEDDERVITLGTVALQDPAGAAEMLRELRHNAVAGVMIATQIGRLELDDPVLTPFWEAANDLDAVVYLHPSFAAGARHAPHGLVNGLARLEDTTLTLARLLYAGIPARYPRMRLVASHGGGALPYVLGRLVRNQAVVAGDAAAPLDSFHHLFFDTVVFDAAALRFLVQQAGADHVLLGSDYPFPIGDLSPRRVVEHSGLSAAVQQQLLAGNARALFGTLVSAAVDQEPTA